MRLVIQRVKYAKVAVKDAVCGAINKGMLVFLGVEKGDSEKDADFLATKIAELRIFEDGQGKMNLSAKEAGAGFLVVSQFTLVGDCSKGRRPSFDKAAEPKIAETLYDYFVEQLKALQFKVETGKFAAMMDVELLNDGPVTFILDSDKR